MWILKGINLNNYDFIWREAEMNIIIFKLIVTLQRKMSHSDVFGQILRLHTAIFICSGTELSHVHVLGSLSK